MEQFYSAAGVLKKHKVTPWQLVTLSMQGKLTPFLEGLPVDFSHLSGAQFEAIFPRKEFTSDDWLEKRCSYPVPIPINGKLVFHHPPEDRPFLIKFILRCDFMAEQVDSGSWKKGPRKPPPSNADMHAVQEAALARIEEAMDAHQPIPKINALALLANKEEPGTNYDTRTLVRWIREVHPLSTDKPGRMPETAYLYPTLSQR